MLVFICGHMEGHLKPSANCATLSDLRKRGQRRLAAERAAYSVEAEWTETDLALLEELKRAEAIFPQDAPRALLSIRLSVLTDDTTLPVRQELDLRILARERGSRVVGVASDLNVSATKVPPWKRKELGGVAEQPLPRVRRASVLKARPLRTVSLRSLNDDRVEPEAREESGLEERQP